MIDENKRMASFRRRTDDDCIELQTAAVRLPKRDRDCFTDKTDRLRQLRRGRRRAERCGNREELNIKN